MKKNPIKEFDIKSAYEKSKFKQYEVKVKELYSKSPKFKVLVATSLLAILSIIFGPMELVTLMIEDAVTGIVAVSVTVLFIYGPKLTMKKNQPDKRPPPDETGGS